VDIVGCSLPLSQTRVATNRMSDGPVFYNYFLEQNEAIANKSCEGYELNFNTLGVSSPISMF